MRGSPVGARAKSHTNILAIEGGPCRVKRRELSPAKIIHFSSNKLPLKDKPKHKGSNSGQEGDLRRNKPPPYNIRPLQPQVEEQEGDEPLPVARRRTTRHQPRRETRTERLEQRIDTLTELVNMLVATPGQNAANATPVIPLANVESEEVLPPQEGREVAVGSTQADTDVRRKCARRRHRTRHEDQGDAPESCASEHA